MKQAIIFDMDGTILFSESIHFSAFKRIFEKYGGKWEWDDFLKNYTGTGSHHIIKSVFEKNGIHADINKAAEEKGIIFRELLGKEKLKAVPGFFEFYEKAAAAGLPMIVASGTGRENIEQALKNIGAAQLFKKTVSARDVGKHKPAPDVFLEAARQLSLPPSACVVFEDARSGIAAATAAGMRCVGLTTNLDEKTLRETGADIVIPDYTVIDDMLWTEIFS